MVILGVAVGIVVGALLLCLISHFTRRSFTSFLSAATLLNTRSISAEFILNVMDAL